MTVRVGWVWSHGPTFNRKQSPRWSPQRHHRQQHAGIRSTTRFYGVGSWKATTRRRPRENQGVGPRGGILGLGRRRRRITGLFTIAAVRLDAGAEGDHLCATDETSNVPGS